MAECKIIIQELFFTHYTNFQLDSGEQCFLTLSLLNFQEICLKKKSFLNTPKTSIVVA